MDGGVPIKRPVAGISTGLFTHKDNKNYTMVTDIQGTEDFFGDMDFKVAGTEKGITAIQVDIKIDGLTYEIIEEAFERCNKARHMILNDVMKKAISEPRKNISTYAPQIAKVQIEVDKIKDLIGPSGKNINKIIDETKVEIDIDDNGLVLVYGNQDSDMEKAMKMIEESTKVYKVGEIVTGIVTSIQKFGAFITLPGNKEGLLHISKISEKRVDNVEDVLKIGDEVTTKIENIDTDGKIALNRKDIFKK